MWPNPQEAAYLISFIEEILKGTLMQIWKFHYMLGSIQKQHPENFAFLDFRIDELFTGEDCVFLKY